MSTQTAHRLSGFLTTPRFGAREAMVATIIAIWTAVAMAAVFSPDLISGSDQRHLPVAAMTWWIWASISTALVVRAVSSRQRKTIPGDEPWFAFAAGVGLIWLVAVLLSVFTARQVTGSDPTQTPVAAVIAPFFAMLATGMVAGLLAERWSERTALAIGTVFVVVAASALSLRVVALPEPVRVNAPVEDFSSGRALPHLQVIAQSPSPTGSAENARVRDYIAAEISRAGLTPEIQSTVAVHPEDGSAYRVDNVLARLPGSESTKAVLIVGHYDSVASGPGAGDNKLSVAAMLEALRALQARSQLRNDVIFLFPDAEEYGLIGAQAFIDEHPWAKDVGVVFNYDATDAKGPLVLMKTTGEDGWLVSNMAQADAGIFIKSHQNDERDAETFGTDFDAFRKAGYTAVDLNNWTRQTNYHTRLDNLDHVDEGKLQAYGDSMVQLAQHFGSIDLAETSAPDRVYSSVFGKNFVVQYAKAWTLPLTLIAIGALVSVLVLGIRRGRIKVGILAVSTGVFLAFLIGCTVLVTVAWGVIEGMHDEVQWQQEVELYHGSLLFGGLMALVLAAYLAVLVWARKRVGVVHLQSASLMLSLVVAAAMALGAPFFSYVALWPLLAMTAAFGASMFIPEDRPGRAGLLRASVFWLAAGVVLGVYGPLLWRVLFNSAYDAGPLQVAILILVAGLMATVVDLMLPQRRHIWMSGGLVVVAVMLLGVGYTKPSFDAEHPRPQTLFYVMDADTNTARWASLDEERDPWLASLVPVGTSEATTAEDVLGVAASPFEDADWLISRMPAWTSNAPVLAVPAPTLTLLSDRRDGDLRTMKLRASSPRGGRVISVAPENEIVSASVDGKAINVYEGWRFVFVGLPAEGVELEMTLRTTGRAVFVVFDQTDGPPPALIRDIGPEPSDTMPAILPRWARGYPAFVTRTQVIP